MILREGLPHPGFEKAVFDVEIRRPDVMFIEGWPFYAEPLAVRADTIATLESLLADPASFGPWNGEKRCGGFHPDFAISQPHPSGDTHILLCLGCREALFIGGPAPHRVNLMPGVAFEGTLAGYRLNRPETPRTIPRRGR